MVNDKKISLVPLSILFRLLFNIVLIDVPDSNILLSILFRLLFNKEVINIYSITEIDFQSYLGYYLICSAKLWHKHPT